MRLGLTRTALRLAARTEEGRELLRHHRAEIQHARDLMAEADACGLQQEIAEADELIRRFDKVLAKHRTTVAL